MICLIIGENSFGEAKNAKHFFESNRSNGYSVIPRGYSLSILASDRRSLIPLSETLY